MKTRMSASDLAMLIQRAVEIATSEIGPAQRRPTQISHPTLRPGVKLYHTAHGEVLAVCTYVGPSRWRYSGKIYTSASAAALAASNDLGFKAKTICGWIFWGVEKRVTAGGSERRQLVIQ